MEHSLLKACLPKPALHLPTFHTILKQTNFQSLINILGMLKLMPVLVISVVRRKVAVQPDLSLFYSVPGVRTRFALKT